MNAKWLAERDAEFHKRQLRYLNAQLALAHYQGFGYDGIVKRKIELLLELSKISSSEANTIASEVRAEMAQTEMGLQELIKERVIQST